MNTLILIIALALMAPQAHQQPQDARKPCIGVIVRADIQGVEIVKRADKTLCSRPAAGQPSKTRVKR